jgi:hypothetical protein
MNKKFLGAAQWLLQALQLQFFITLISVPMLAWWGLPLSLLTVVGNLIFNPFLAIFLFLASLVFFTELLHLPNGLLVLALEYISKFWLKLISFDAQPWLMGLTQPSVLGICLVPVTALGILHYKKNAPAHTLFHTVHKTLLYLGALVLFCTCITFMGRITAPPHQELACNRGHVTLVYDNNKLALIDPGVIGQRISASSWVEYTLIPHLARTMGKTNIEHVIILQPNGVLFKALALLITKVRVGQVFLPEWDGTLPWHCFEHFEKFRHLAQEKKIPIIWLSKKPYTLTLSPTCSLTMTPQEKSFVQAKVHIPLMVITGHVDRHQLAIYSHAYKKKLICA